MVRIDDGAVVSESATMHDAIIIGGGPAGLSAALMLGRCRRRVLLFDAGQPRNARSAALHGFLTRDGMPPNEFITTARLEIERYGVEMVDAEVTAVRRIEGGFEVDATTRRGCARTLLLATGISDNLPNLPGFADMFGRSVFVCPYCDGWEVAGTAVGVYGHGEQGARFALGLCAWSDDIVLFGDAPFARTPALQRTLDAGVRLSEHAVVALRGNAGRLEAVQLANGEEVPRSALFVSLGQRQRSADLAVQLGCQVSDEGGIECDSDCRSLIPGLFIAGDVSREVQLAIVAAAEGTIAGYGMHKHLGVTR